MHKPVLLNESIELLNIKSSGVYLDATFGAGGHSSHILTSNSDVTLIGMDIDNHCQVYANLLKQKFGERFFFINDNYVNMEIAVKKLGFSEVDGILMDLGVSSMQLDTADRGFAFMKSGKLDMRMGNQELSAHHVINQYQEQEIGNIIRQYGEEKHYKNIARNIVKYRNQVGVINNTDQLSGIICKSTPPNYPNIHPATRTFQAIRIYVNQELERIKQGLNSATNILKNNAVICVISFHSLEDRIVKQFFANNAKINKSRLLPWEEPLGQAKFQIINKKVIRSTDEEAIINPRSRSAKLRASIRINKQDD